MPIYKIFCEDKVNTQNDNMRFQKISIPLLLPASIEKRISYNNLPDFQIACVGKNCLYLTSLKKPKYNQILWDIKGIMKKVVSTWTAYGYFQRCLNSQICHHCRVKTSTVFHSFNHVLIILLNSYNSVPSFIENQHFTVCQVIL